MLFSRWLFLLHSICPGFPGEERLYDDLNKEHSLQSVISSTVWNAYFYLIACGTVLALTQTHYATESQTHSPLILFFICVFGFPLEFADSTCRFFCSIYFAEQFRLLRKRIFADGEEKYELHFVIDYMSRTYGTINLLYLLSKAGRRVGEGVYSGRFLVGVCYAVTQFEWDYSSAPVRVLFRCTVFFPIEFSKRDQYVWWATKICQFSNEKGGLQPKCLPQLFLESRLNWPIRSITRV